MIEILFNIFHRRITQKHCSVSFLKDKFWIIYLLLGVNKIQMVKVNFSINVFYIYNINDNRKIPQTTPTWKIWKKNTELTEVLEFIIETYMVKATICLIQSYLL